MTEPPPEATDQQTAEIAAEARERLGVTACVLVTFGSGTRVSVATPSSGDEALATARTREVLRDAISALSLIYARKFGG